MAEVELLGASSGFQAMGLKVSPGGAIGDQQFSAGEPFKESISTVSGFAQNIQLSTGQSGQFDCNGLPG
jgi:hypothetical protein